MDFQDYLTESANKIEETSNGFFKKWQLEVKQISHKLLPVIEKFVNQSTGGKRLRGTLIRLGYELMGGKFTKDITQVSVGYELFNTAILAHDDIIDLSPLRRGKKSLYTDFGGDHYGISQALALGDIGLFLSIKLLCETNFPDNLKQKATYILTRNIIDTAFGEILDVEIPHLKERRDPKDVLTISHLKTAQYTITGPMQLGAVLGGANQKLLYNLAVYGENLGIAFQIQDDILGVFGNEKTLGKSVTSDIEEGKNTLLITYALEKGSKEHKAILNKYYGKGRVGGEGLEGVRRVFQETGSLDYSKAQALKYVDQAKKVIPKITTDPKCIALLVGLADFLINRQK